MQLRDYQLAAISSLWQSWKASPRGAPLLVLPTGSGKSCVISGIIHRITTAHPSCRFLIVTHTKEIVRQNSADLQTWMPTEPIGIYSAGLGSKRIQRITFANVQSIYRSAKTLHVDLLIIDEAHLLSSDDNSMYQKLISNLQGVNPKLKIMGLTATPMRMDQGSLVADGSTFTEIAYSISIKELIEKGYLSSLVSMSKQTVDLSDVKMSGHDYNQGDVQLAFNKSDIVTEQCKEIVVAAKDRKHWLVFCAGIEHAETVTESLRANGVSAEYVTGDMPTMIRDTIINRFMTGETKALCNVGVLTTGFNFKPIDLIVLLRATKSVGLYIQMIGRGTRVAEGKLNCCVLDYGGNIERHGPIDLIEVTTKKERMAEVGVAPHKKCPICQCVVAIGAKVCPSCDYPYPEPTAELEIRASTASVLSPSVEEIRAAAVKDLPVVSRSVAIGKGKMGKPDNLRVTYACADRYAVSDYLCFDHDGYPASLAAKKWIAAGGDSPSPQTVADAFNRRDELRHVVAMRVDVGAGRFPKILSLTFGKTPVVEYDENDLNL